MIVGAKFAWGHIPRTGGDITSELFRVVDKSLGGHFISKRDPMGSHSKHDTFDPEAEGKLLVLNIRRLPSFMMSWIVMCAGCLREEDSILPHRGGVWPKFERLPVPSKLQLLNPIESYGPEYFRKLYSSSFATLPDSLLEQYIGSRTINIWLRLEHLREDFVQFMKQIEVTNPRTLKRIRRRKFRAKKPIGYNHSVEEYFSKDEIAILYKNNPTWAAIEAKVYK